MRNKYVFTIFAAILIVPIYFLTQANTVNSTNAAVSSAYDYRNDWEIHTSSIGIFQPKLDEYRIGNVYLFKHKARELQLYSKNSDWNKRISDYTLLLERINEDIADGNYGITFKDNDGYEIQDSITNNLYTFN